MRTYFYKADEFPEVRVNERHEMKSLANSCHITLPVDPFDYISDPHEDKPIQFNWDSGREDKVY